MLADTLDANLTEQLKRIIANDSQLSFSVDFTGLNSSTASPGPIAVEHKLLCTTADSSPDVHERDGNTTRDQTHTSRQNVNVQLPYSIDGLSLIADLGAAVEFTLVNGKDETFVSKLVVPEQRMSLKEMEKQSDVLAQKGLTFHVYRVDESTIKFVMVLHQKTSSQVDLSHSENGVSMSRSVSVPLDFNLVAEGTYQLVN